jgi:hypothetical protein
MSVSLARFPSAPVARQWRGTPLTRHHRAEAGRRYDFLAAQLNSDPRNSNARRELVSIIDYLDRYGRSTTPIPWGWETTSVA